MREILFRGKFIKTSTWVYGHFVESEGVCFIYSKNENNRWMVHEVIPDSVGQATWFMDKKNVHIFEKDKCDVVLASGRHVHAFVVFVDGCFELHFVSPIEINHQYNDRDYLKCHTINHAVEVIPED